MTKNAIFGQNCVILGQKILIFTGESKSFGTHFTEKPPKHLVCIVFWSAWDKMGQKCQYLAQSDQECRFLAKFGCFWAKNPYYFRRKQKFWYQCKGKTTYAPCLHHFLAGHGTKWAKNANIWPKSQYWVKFGRFGPKIPIFVRVSKSFGTNITKKRLGYLSALSFSRHGIEWAKKAKVWPKVPSFGQIGRFWAENPFLGGWSKTFGTLISGVQ